MFQNILRHLGGVANYGVISICLFFVVFSVALIWTFTRKRSEIEIVERLPLTEDSSAPLQ